MKKNIAFILLALLFVQCDRQDIVTQDKSRLPQPAQDFIATYFPTEEVDFIKIDKELSTTYEVRFASGTELAFDKNGDWIEVDCKQSAVPEDIIPPGHSGLRADKLPRQANHANRKRWAAV